MEVAKEIIINEDIIAVYGPGPKRLRYCRWECTKVMDLDHLYLGGQLVASNKSLLEENGITHVLNCGGLNCEEYFKNEVLYKTLWFEDAFGEDIISVLYDVFDYIEYVKKQGGRIMVYCFRGVSTALVLGYLMWREKKTYVEVAKSLYERVSIGWPNLDFDVQLERYEEWMKHASGLRMYRMAPHSPCDPTYLVPKLLKKPSPYGLDSRGAFIIQVHPIIYVWIGESCDAIMERDTLASALQVVYYECLDGPIWTIKDGEEPPSFWDAFSVDEAEDSVAVNIGAGKKKVDSYNEDFMVFNNALQGIMVKHADKASKWIEFRNALYKPLENSLIQLGQCKKMKA